MFTDEYIVLLNVLIKSVQEGTLSWIKVQDAHLAYESAPMPDSTMRVDKYYSISETNESTPCWDFCIFSKEGNIIDEIVFCRNEQEVIWRLMKELYDLVEEKVFMESNPHIPIELRNMAGFLIKKRQEPEILKGADQKLLPGRDVGG